MNIYRNLHQLPYCISISSLAFGVVSYYRKDILSHTRIANSRNVNIKMFFALESIAAWLRRIQCSKVIVPGRGNQA